MSIKTSLDMKGWDEIYKQLQDLDNYEAEAGYYGEDIHDSSGLPMSNLAWIHNEGAELDNGTTIPARPFMDQSFVAIAGSDFGKYEMKEILFYGKTPKSQLENMAKKMANQISISIEYGSFVENSPYTLARKRGDDPLIDTSEMKNTPKDKVVKKGSDD